MLAPDAGGYRKQQQAVGGGGRSTTTGGRTLQHQRPFVIQMPQPLAPSTEQEQQRAFDSGFQQHASVGRGGTAVQFMDEMSASSPSLPAYSEEKPPPRRYGIPLSAQQQQQQQGYGSETLKT